MSRLCCHRNCSRPVNPDFVKHGIWCTCDKTPADSASFTTCEKCMFFCESCMQRLMGTGLSCDAVTRRGFKCRQYSERCDSCRKRMCLRCVLLSSFSAPCLSCLQDSE